SPESSTGSYPSKAMAASANEKLAPHSAVAGKMTTNVRSMSTWKLNHGFEDNHGSIGQYGRTSASMCAVHATAPAIDAWKTPRTIRGHAVRRTTNDPATAPHPSPARKTARIIENV